MSWTEGLEQSKIDEVNKHFEGVIQERLKNKFTEIEKLKSQITELNAQLEAKKEDTSSADKIKKLTTEIATLTKQLEESESKYKELNKKSQSLLLDETLNKYDLTEKQNGTIKRVMNMEAEDLDKEIQSWIDELDFKEKGTPETKNPSGNPTGKGKEPNVYDLIGTEFK